VVKCCSKHTRAFALLIATRLRSVPFLSGDIILSWPAWPRCCLAMANTDRRYMVKSSFSIRDDGRWYGGPHIKGILFACT